jgi:hypothetical protein
MQLQHEIFRKFSNQVGLSVFGIIAMNVVLNVSRFFSMVLSDSTTLLESSSINLYTPKIIPLVVHLDLGFYTFESFEVSYATLSNLLP